LRDFEEQRRAMVADQLNARGIADRRVLEAMARVPRERFVDEKDAELAYADMPLRIGFGQTISQPYMVALMCQEADVDAGERVLDIGTGSGYQAAVFAEMGADVHSIERIRELAETARRTLASVGYDAVTVHVGDGSLGLPKEGPFDAVAVAAAAPDVPWSLYDQLAPDGRLVVPVGGPDGQRLEVITRSEEGPAVSRSVPCRFVPLVGAEGY
jgi:protein-L-isoaspartate(D-aspartate) O-methyltransferase